MELKTYSGTVHEAPKHLLSLQHITPFLLPFPKKKPENKL
jgi:hypothetical protein